MIKKSIILLSLILFFVGCAERGSNVPVKLIKRTVMKHIAKDKTESFPTLVLKSSREDSVQENISAGLILTIALVLLL